MLQGKKKWMALCISFCLTAVSIPGFCADGKKTVSPVADSQDAMSRLHNRTTQMVFEMIGRGSSSHWILQGVANFRYTVIMQAKSTIEEKKALPRGQYQITELHEISKATDSLGVTDADLSIRIDNFDSQRFNKFFNASCSVIAALGNPELAAFLFAGKKTGEATLKQFDGVSVKAFLEELGISADEAINNFMQDKFQKAFRAKIRPVQGKCYKITYILNNAHLPIDVTYTYKDGSPITDEEELQVLQRVNVFVDAHAVPNRKCRVGDEWPIRAEDIEEVMDPYVDGHYSGDITVVRTDNDTDGTWNLMMKQANLSIIGKAGNSTGNIVLKSGSGKVDPKYCTVEEIHTKGNAKLNSLSRHHWLFKARVNGWCSFVGHLYSIREK